MQSNEQEERFEDNPMNEEGCWCRRNQRIMLTQNASHYCS